MTKHSERARREFVSVVELVVLAFVIGIPIAGPLMPARASTNHDVNMYDYRFDLKFTTVAPGDTITWHNLGIAPHTATSNTTAWAQVSVSPGQSSPATLMPTLAGNYTYHCIYHGGAPNYMWGAIIVSTAVPEFSSSLVVVVGMLVMALGLMLVRRKL
jgi:plastocyanin